VPVLSADTLIDFQGHPLEKPQTSQEAWAWYRLLAGRTHRVLTALTLWNPRLEKWQQEVETTKIRFVAWDEDYWAKYLATNEWEDAAGGYKIQESGERLVEQIQGSWSNVVGLPLARFYGMLRQCQSLPRSSRDKGR
jgi:septum formation protein